MNGRALVVGADAARLPFPDGWFDCVVTSPPYWGVREYEDDGEPIPGQLGSEPDWHAYLDTLVAWTAEWVRVLSPHGSLFVNLGDKYSDRGHGSSRGLGTGRGPQGGADLSQSRGVMEKSLLNLPARYAIRCTDELGLVERAEIIWQKLNPVPQSVRDRVRRQHEHLFHFSPGPHCYQATDLIREPIGHPGKSRTSAKARDAWAFAGEWKHKQAGLDSGAEHPLGRIPGSVWSLPNYPLKAPGYYWREPGGGVRWLRDDAEAWAWVAETGRDRSRLPRSDRSPELRAAPDHYAAFPPDLVRPAILGWCPLRVCLACGRGRFPVTAYTGQAGRRPGGQDRYDRHLYAGLSDGALRARAITGWACACTPVTNHGRGRQAPTVTPGRMLSRGPGIQEIRAAATGSRHHGNAWPERPPQYEYHFDGWEPPPTRPGRVLDPCGGTGTAPLVAAMLGMDAVTVDISHGYRLLASWRLRDPGERAAALGVARPKPVPSAQRSMFDEDGDPVLFDAGEAG